MNYNGSPAGSSPSSPTYALHDYFGYTCEPFNDFSRNSQVIQKRYCSAKPVYAHLLYNPGHAVLLDGYDSNGFFHINFGWGGGGNGYYMLNNNSLIYSGNYKFVDPFAGSGSTAVTARKLGRRFVAIERSEQYCAWAEKRLEMAADNPAIQGYADGVFWDLKPKKK